MKLEVGMYVRTKRKWLKYPQIARICKITKDRGYKNQRYIELDKNLIPDYEYHIYEEEIGKASHNIKELIQENDYVNGNKVININGTLYVKDEGALEDIVIKSIVTCEQFASMEYKVGE